MAFPFPDVRAGRENLFREKGLTQSFPQK